MLVKKCRPQLDLEAPSEAWDLAWGGAKPRLAPLGAWLAHCLRCLTCEMLAL